MSSYESSFRELIDKIQAARRKENTMLFAEGLFHAAGVFFIALFAVVIIEAFANGDTVFRTALAGIVLVSGVIGIGVFVIPAALRAFGIKNFPTENEIALRIGQKFPQMKDRLGNALQLIPIVKNPRGQSGNLALAAFDDVYRNFGNLNFDEIISPKKFRRALLFFVISIGVSLGSIFSINPLNDSAFRVANFATSFIPPAPFTIEIEPLKQTSIRGDNVIIRVKATGEAPEEIELNIKEEQQENYDSFPLKLDTANTYVYSISSAKNSLSFFGKASWMGTSITTKTGKIKVIEQPLIRSVSGRVVYPSYTGLAPSNFTESNADITALRGSRADFTVYSNKELVKAEIVFVSKIMGQVDSLQREKLTDTTRYGLKAEGQKASGNFRITNSGKYHIEITDPEGEKNTEPIEYAVIALNDNYPEISLIDPLGDVKVNANAILPIKTAISDDFGFSSLKLYYRLAESPYTSPDEEFTPVIIDHVFDGLVLEVPYVWDLNELGISPEDRYEFYLEVADNDIVSGPKTARTQILSVRLPSMDEVLRETDRNTESIESELQKALKESERIRKDMDELQRELQQEKNQKEMNWEQRKKAEDIVKRQNELNNKMSEIQEQMNQTTEQLQENNLLSEETLQKYKQLQELMSQVQSPELQQMQKQMEDALKNMNPEDMQKAMEDFKFDEEQFRKGIERSMKILKRLQAEQKADALQKRAEEMAKEQDKITEEMNKNKGDKEKTEELAKRQDKLREQMDKLDKEMSELEELMNELGADEMPMQQLDQAKQDLNSEQTKSEMEKSSEQMQQNNQQQAQQSQQQSSQNLKSFANQMNQMKQQMQSQNSEFAKKKLQKFIEDMVSLSKEQEEIKEKTQKSDFNSTRIPDFAKEQARTFEALANLAGGMAKLSEKSFAVTSGMGAEVSQAMNEMREAIESMADRKMSQATNAQGEAMGAMNRALMQMNSMMSSMMQQPGGQPNSPGQGNPGGEGQGGGMPFGQQMQQMAAQQQAINQAMRQMMQGGGTNPGNMTPEQQSEMGRLQDKMGGAQKSVEELAEEQKKFKGDKKKAKELEDIAKEMEEVMSDMETEGITEETLKRQERILSKMLDAQRSVNERDFEKRRESKPGKELDITSPEWDMTSEEARKKALQELLKSNSRKYTKDYDLLIRRYFEAMKDN